MNRQMLGLLFVAAIIGILLVSVEAQGRSSRRRNIMTGREPEDEVERSTNEKNSIKKREIEDDKKEQDDNEMKEGVGTEERNKGENIRDENVDEKTAGKMLKGQKIMKRSIRPPTGK